VTGWLIFAGYCAAALVAARRVYWYMLDDFEAEDGLERAGLTLLAFVCGVLWPLALPMALIMWAPRPTSREIEAEREQMQSRINELERELGIAR
jgi:hypothetical protein